MSRKSTRTHAFKLIYQLDFPQKDIDEIYDFYSPHFENSNDEEKLIIQDEFFGVAENLSYINEIISQYSKWQISRLNKIDLALIRLAIYEMLYEKNKPSIVINEIVNLSNVYGTQSSAGFVNGILAQIAVDIEKGVLYE
jgi:transcription antitermination factor NusB